MSCNMSFRESSIAAQYEFEHWTLFHQKFEKNCPRIFPTMATKRAFLLVDEFTQKAFRQPWIPGPGSRIQIIVWRVRPRSRTQVGSSESPWRSSRSSRGAFQIQKFEIYLVLLSQSQNDETTKRQTMKQRNLLETVKSLTELSFRNGSGP